MVDTPFMASASAEAYVPIALEADDIATYSAMAEALGCALEDCATGFMLATPKARRAAALIWVNATAVRSQIAISDASLGPTAGRLALELKHAQALHGLRGLIGLDPQAMPHDALADIGLRYRA